MIYLKRTYWGLGITALAVFLILLMVLAITPQFAAAAPPSTMNFQGRLRDNSSGSIMADGLYNMQFRIFTVSSGGSAAWTETRQASHRVQVTNGLFSTQLGEVNPLPASLFDVSDLYFEVTMASPATANCSTAGCATWEPAMTPRNKLATSAYAFNAARLDGRAANDFASATGSAGYIQNTSAEQVASFNVSGTGRVAGMFTAAGDSTFGGTMTVNSTGTFRSNSTMAFRLQNSAGTLTLLSGDTTNNLIQIGSATTDTTAIRLVLDSSNSSSDPTGSNGSMYYSTSKAKMRCYENDAWKNCDTAKGSPTTQSSNYTAQNGDFVLANSSAGGFTVTLPTPTSGATVSVKKISAGGTVIVSGGGVLIDNLSSETLTSQWHSQDYFSDGVQWYRV